MSIAYKILYGIGFTPWEKIGKSKPIVEQVSSLFAREEAGREPPYGQALDLGCGSAIWSVALAARGWQVTGVDDIPKALRKADRRAREAGVQVRLVEADVTKLRSVDIGSEYRLLLDFGLFHDELTDEQRQAMGREVSAVAAPSATLLMMACEPGHRGKFGPRGANRTDIEAAYPAWNLLDEERLDDEEMPKVFRKAKVRFYRLQHEAEPQT